MKVVIEISDDTLRHAIEQQVGKAVANFTEAAIKDQVEAIVSTKLGRVSDAKLDEILRAAAHDKFNLLLGSNDWSRNGQLKTFLSDAAVRLIKETK